MRLPIKNKQSPQILSLPDLAGGINMRDGISEVLDNQLTECKNMWWNDGALRTRPAMYEASKIAVNAGNGVSTQIRLHNCYKIQYGTKIRLCSVETKLDDGTYYINFFWLRANGLQSFSQIKFASASEFPSSYFVCQCANILYCFTNKRVIYKTEIENGSWTKVEEKDYYTPLVATSCKKLAKTNASTQQAMESGVMIEGFNILSDYYKMSFNSYNPEIVTEENQSHDMRYHILKSIPSSTSKAYESYKGKTITAVLTINGTECTHTITLSESFQIAESTTSWEEKAAREDGFKMKVWRNSISFWKENSETKKEEIVRISDGGENDLIITAPYITSNTEKDKVFGMKRCEWFGGGAAGLSGGTRLFLCGNNKTSNSDLVVWSGLNNPLYFPENCYFYVGNQAGAVTGFGKQADKLIIFKETETWCTEYVQNTNIDAESLINGNVIDFASSSVYFPLTQINSNIGCAYPDTVQLCRNRLVWLGGDNKVYTLVSESPYTERSIYCVSEMVDRKIHAIAKQYDISSATACDWEGYYCLLLKGTILLMDYNCNGYTHIASHSKTEDANIKIPWFLWTVPKGSSAVNIGTTLILAEFEYGESGCKMRSFYFTDFKVDFFLDDNNVFYESKIESSFTTKIFNFGIPHIRKNIEQLNIQLGNNDGEPIKVFFVTENGTEETQVFTDGTETQNYTAGYITSRAVFPCIKHVLRCGLKFESYGTLAVDSVILKYRTLGGAR